jgi:predicted kinase
VSETLLRSGGSGSLGGSSRHPLTRPRSCIADLDLFLQSAHEGLWDTRSHAPTDYSPGMEAVIFCGVQGSGKSTFYTDRLADSHVRINLDMLRSRRREQILLRACIEAKQPFVVDNTNPTIKSRRRYIVPARIAGFSLVSFYFHILLGDAIARNRARPPREQLRPGAIVGTYRRLQPPSKQEGYARIYLVGSDDGSGFTVTEIDDLAGRLGLHERA